MLIFLFFIFILYCSTFSETSKTGNCGKRIFGFLGHMSRNNFTDNQTKMLTHLIHNGIKIVAPAKVDLFGSRLEQIMRVANRNPNLLVILGLDIRSDEEIQIFRQILKDNDLRKKLINEITYILQIKNLNGVNFNWFWPSWNDESDFELFLCEIRNNFDEKNFVNATISFTMPQRNFNRNMRSLLNCSNFVNLYLSHYFSANNPVENQAILTGPMSPLFYNDNKKNSRMTIFQTLNNFACHSEDIQKLNIIFVGYGYAYSEVSNPLWDGDGMWRISEQPFFYMDWKQVKKEYAGNKFIFHEPTKTSYIFDEEKRRFISIDDPKSIQIKLEFAERYGIGGVGFELEQDDINNTLFYSISSFQQMCSQNSSFFQCNSTAKYDSYFYQSRSEMTIMEFIQINIHFFILALIIMGMLAIIFLLSSHRVFRLYNQQLDSPKLLKIETDDGFSLKLLHEIGKGRFGEVFLAEWGNKQVALKTIDKQFEWSRRQITREAAILGNLNHENICVFHGLVELNKNHWGLADRLGLINEFAPLGNLLDFLRARSVQSVAPPILMPLELSRIALMLSRALQYLFTKNILHRDIAARNCLVFGESDAKCYNSASRPNFTIKLSDFGMARSLNEYSMVYYMRQLACICFCFINKKSEKVALHLQPPLLMVQPLPIRWSSPETLKERKYSFASEIWSYGILLYEIFSYGKVPFGDVEEAKLVEIIVKGGHPEIPTNMSSEMKKILESCWNLEPKKRIFINDLCNKMELLFAN